LRQPHDRLFRQIFADAEHAASLLRACLPAALVRALDWSTLRRRTKEFVDENLREHRGDEVFSVLDHDGGERFAVVEHKADADPETAAQQFRYELQIWERCLGRAPAGTPLPPILPVVVHHGDRPWSAPTTLLLGRGGALHPWTDIHLLVVDLARLDEAAILGLGMTDRATAGALFLRVLRFARTEECGPMLDRWLPVLRAVRHAPGGRRAFGGLLTYALEATETSEARLTALVDTVGDRRDKETIMSTAEKLRALARAEGHVEGRAEGLILGQAQTLLRLMASRFGPVPEAVATRVRAASPAELAAWTDRILTAPTLQDVLKPR
jgi:predicted transposase YdaD